MIASSVSVRSVARGYVLNETTILAAICVCDMASTIYLVGTGRAREVNPILAPWLHYGYVSFGIVKVLFTLVPLAAIEVLRPLRPKFCVTMLRLAIVLYLVTYLLGSGLASGLLHR